MIDTSILKGKAGLKMLSLIDEFPNTDPIILFYDRVRQGEQFDNHRKKKNKSPDKNYFKPINEEAIVAYCKSRNEVLRNKIFSEYIDKALKKLVENLIHSFKTYYFDMPYKDVQHTAVVYLIDKINRYEPERGRAFSFLSVIGKNYLITKNSENYNIIKNTDSIDNIIDSEPMSLRHYYSEQNNDDRRHLIYMFIDYLQNNMKVIFPNKKDHVVVGAFIQLYNDRNLVEDYNKKSLYILMREITGLRTQYITRVINKIKGVYLKFVESNK